MSSRITRRTLLKGAAGVAGASLACRVFGVPALLADPSPNSKLATVVIGVANQGLASLSAAVTERLVAMVDVDEGHLAKQIQWIGENSPETKTASVKKYFDYRKLFDEMSKQIDAVFVATPDHHHATAAMLAIKAGKHVYVEKPLGHSIDEVRRLMAAAKKYKVITQLGNQGHSGEGLRRLCEYVDAGAIGHITETYSWAPTGRGGTGGRLPTKPVPAGLHWEEWIGPAAYRDYHEELHPLQWRSWWEFGDGSVGDWGCHNLDGPVTALKLGAPTSVEALEQFGGSGERFPLRNSICWNFPARGKLPPVKVHWFDGYFGLTDSAAHEDAAGAKQNRPPIVEELEKKYGRELKSGGTIYVGEKGILHTGNYTGSPRIIPEEKHKAFPAPPKTYPRVAKSGVSGLGIHQADFLNGCKQGRQPSSNFDVSGPLTEVVLLGCLAEKAGVGKKVEWDSAAMKVTNLPELNRLVVREYRKGWTL